MDPCTSGTCQCHVAKFVQRCQSCLRTIDVGNHVWHFPGGWCHTICPEVARKALVAVEEACDPGAPGPGDHAPEPLAKASGKAATYEQLAILNHDTVAGQRVRVRAVAGAGKTSTCIMLTKRLLAEDPHVRICYVVFNEAARREAQGRFPKEVAIYTSHALAKKHVWSGAVGNYPCPDVLVKEFGLFEVAESRFGNAQHIDFNAANQAQKRRLHQRLQKMARAEATSISKTLNNFLWSDSSSVLDSHVFWKATIPVQVGGKEVAPYSRSFYVEKAQALFDRMQNPEDATFPMTHDGYLKLFELNKVNIGPSRIPSCTNPQCELSGHDMVPVRGRFGDFFRCASCSGNGKRGFDVVIIDEAQDFTPAQASAFFKQSMFGAKVYLIGDGRQRMYRWRGAADDFEAEECVETFRLSESFRFGPAIAAEANAILNLASNGTDGCVVGKNSFAGEVVKSGAEPQTKTSGPSVVITRSNKGMLDELQKRVSGGTVPRWSFIDAKMCRYLVNAHGFEPYLKLKRGEEVRLKGETFSDWDELKEFVEDHGDTKISTMIEIVEGFGADIISFIEIILAQEVEDWREADLAFITAHKAKGLEFERVELAGDFNLPVEEMEEGLQLLSADKIQRPKWQEELNIIYVAITRAQKVIKLSSRIQQVFDLIGHSSATFVSRFRPNAVSAECLEERREQDEVRWALFEKDARDANFVVDVSSVPWPRGPADNILSVHGSMTLESLRRTIHLALLRFHPDKFMVRWARGIPDAQRASGSKLLQQLRDVTQAIKLLKDDFLAHVEAGDASVERADSQPECIICYDSGSSLMRTTCCSKQICADCYAADVGRKDIPTCPNCRRENYELSKMLGRLRDRSRSPRRAA